MTDQAMHRNAAAALVASPATGRVLRPLLLLATAASFYFHLRLFLSSTYAVAHNPDLAYVTLLGAYAGHREVRRWSDEPSAAEERARKGELFVAFWWLFYYIVIIAANHIPSYRVPEGLFPLCVQMTGIFFGALTSQQLHRRRDLQSEQKAGGPQILEEKVEAILKNAKTPKKRADLQAELGVSQTTMSRTLKRMQLAGKIRWTGSHDKDPEGGFSALA